MPTLKYFNQCPPFPADIPVVDLPRISLKSLQLKSHEESKKLYDACCEHGFFLLGLEDSPQGQGLLEDAENMFALTTETFGRGQEYLSKYAYNPPKDLTGYKASGLLKTDDGKTDAMELYSINQDDILGNGSLRENAGPIEEKRKECGDFIIHAHATISVVLDRLDQQLGLSPGTLGSLSSLEEASDTSVRLLLSQPQLSSAVEDRHPITLGGHTDIGTMTLLFNVAGGLQILPAGKENVPFNWQYVRPQPGFAFVNVGDTMVEWTGGLLRSSLHRVIKAPGKQATVPRKSVAYLIRPARNASMSRLKGGIIPPLAEGEQDETRSPSEWAAWRSKQIILGHLKPQTRGGRPVDST